MRTPRKQKNKLSEIRSLKIQPKIRFNKYSRKEVPEIKLCGKWLEKLGFVYGQRVLITSRHQLLIIQLQE
jgi:hypothetical protein